MHLFSAPAEAGTGARSAFQRRPCLNGMGGGDILPA